MSRPFYSEYVRHCMRFYSRNLHIERFKTAVDSENWTACHTIITQLPEKTRDILVSVYGGYDTLADEVYNTSHKYSMNQNIIWDMMKVFERAVAEQRGLV
jgi:hypothetical protein